MKKLFSVIAFFIASTQAIAQPPSDAYIQNLMTAGHLPGVTAVVIKDGKWVFDRSWGKADIPNNKNVSRETMFMLASISKTVMATALMQLWQQGAFQLDDNVNNYLPFAIHNPYHPTDSISFRMLTSHTSAIRDNYTVINGIYANGDSPMSLDSFLANYLLPGGIYYSTSQNFYSYHSGIISNYSNIGATLAAYLVQRITGDDYAHYCDTAIFDKLCMTNTSFKLAGIKDTTMIARPYSWNGASYDDDGLYGFPDYPDGQLRTNIVSLARFMTMYMQYGIYNGTRILDSATVAMMMKDQYPGIVGQGIVFYENLFSSGDTLWGHTGGDPGVSTAMHFSYKTKTGVIVLTNGDAQMDVNMETIMDTLYKYGVTLAPSATDTFPTCTSTVSTGEVAFDAGEHLRIYPNPAHDVLNLESDLSGNEPINLAITDMIGSNKIMMQMKPSRNMEVDISRLTSGTYLLQVSSGQKKTTMRFVKL